MDTVKSKSEGKSKKPRGRAGKPGFNPVDPMILNPGTVAVPSEIPAAATFTVSARGKRPGERILDFLAKEFGFLDLSHIESVFGFVERCDMYGGRPFVQRELSDQDVHVLHHCCIGLRLPLSNHDVSRDEYERYKEFLAKYHQTGNSVITNNDELALWVRRDFPNYEIEASVIKDTDSQEKIARLLELYDTVVLPMRMNLDIAFLQGIGQKNRITLFANAGCALNCPAKICYRSFSKANKTIGAKTACSFSKKPRELYGMVNFDLMRLAELGFTRFKLLRMRGHGLTGF